MDTKVCGLIRNGDGLVAGAERGRFSTCWKIRPHCGQSLQSVIPIMISEPIATTAGQINGNSSSTPTTTARTWRVLFICAKRQTATPIGHLRLAHSTGGDSSTRSDPRL